MAVKAATNRKKRPQSNGPCLMAVRPANRTERDKHTGLSVFSPLLALSVRTKCHKHCLIKGLGAKSNANCQDKKHPVHRDCAAQRGLGGRCLPGGHYMPLKNSCCTNPSLSRHRLRPLAASALLLGALASGSVWAQNYPITEGQRSRATQVAEAGVPLSELAPNAPSSYKIKRGDTLWAISGLFLKSPWRWPELWGMNLDDIKNPHLIYPGQELFLDTSNGRARLTTRRPDGAPMEVRVSPRVRSESLSDSAIPAISMQAIEAFLAEPMIVDEETFSRAPRIVATPESRVLLSMGDRAYARSLYGSNGEGEPLSTAKGQPRQYRVFRNAVPLKDPTTGEVLGYEAQYVGGATIVRDESRKTVEVAPQPVSTQPVGKDDYKSQFENTSSNVTRTEMAAKPQKEAAAPESEIVPATIDITRAKEEMRVGDRLLPEPPREFTNYVPSAPALPLDGRIVSVYGSAVLYAAQNQVVSINRGLEHGVVNGNVFALLRDTHRLTDKTDDSNPQMRLPGERNGLMMVFRTFDKVSYALVLQINDGVKVGDRFVNP